MKNYSILLAGFGGQGILFAGKIIAYAGLMDNLEVSWLPSYGPEMRGGTANCSVTLSDEPIGSPLIINPNILCAMNIPSFDKFIGEVVEGGIAVVDSSLVDKKSDRTDISCYYIPATAMANEENLRGLANMIMLGKILKVSGFTTLENLFSAIEKSVPESKSHLLEPNQKAVRLGYNHV